MTLLMGIVNVTPDSFSDGGRYVGVDDAIAHGRALAAAGADILDIGGESTRPGAERVPPEVELARVLPVIEALAADGTMISIDTMNAATAAAAIDAGALIVNDVSGDSPTPRSSRWSPTPRCTSRSDTGAAPPTGCTPARTTTTSWTR